ncbi:MAG: FecR family protein [Desulfobaccales bacterium]
MKMFARLWGILAAVFLLACCQAQAAVVGRLTQVDGRVDLLKGGNLPATPVKVDDTVEPQDVIRTKSLSKAQITFIDNSVITISPESRIAIETYMVDLAKGKRQAVLEVFQGLALALVNKIYKAEEPDFVIKTHTAIMGVRGTEIGIRVHPNSSTIMNFKGLTQVGNIFPEVSQLFLKAFKVAYSFGSVNDKSGRWVFLKDMQGTTVDRNLPPTLPYGITSQDRDLFMRQLTTAAPQVSKTYQGGDTTRSAALPLSPGAATTPVSVILPGAQGALTILNTVTVPPTVPQPAVTPSQPAAPPPSQPKNSGPPGGDSNRIIQTIKSPAP